uniref:Prohead protease n=1 Tax=viral metagenome TaxID=1070528 RepID=A0A6H1ZRD7_9ZZZZ
MKSLSDIPIESVLEHPLVLELTDSLQANFGVKVPYIMKDQVLMESGIWNEYYYDSAVINNLFENTNWEDGKATLLFLDHRDDSVREWVGHVENPKIKDGKVLGDLIIVDPVQAVKLALSKPKIGISPRIKAQYKGNEVKRGFFENFSLVINPAVKTAYINNAEVKKMAEEENQIEESEEELRKKKKEIEEKLAKKKYPYPYKMPDEEKREMAEMIADELAKKKKPEEEEVAKKIKKPEEMEEFSEDDLAEIDEEMKKKASAWIQKVKEWLKKHPGKGVKDAVKALKKSEEELAEELKKKKYPEIPEEKSERLTGGAGTETPITEDPDEGMLLLFKEQYMGIPFEA